MRAHILLFVVLLSLSLVLAAEPSRLPDQLAKQDESAHRSKSFAKHGSQVLKTWKGVSSVKIIKDKRKFGWIKENESRYSPVSSLNPEYASYGIPAQGQIYSAKGPLPAGAFAGKSRDYGLSKQRIKGFVIRRAKESPVQAS